MLPATFSTCGVGYTVNENGTVQIDGLGFPTYDAAQVRSKIEQIWTNYGTTISRVSKEYSIPPAWLVGIIYIESGGNPRAASACVEATCPGLWRRGLCAAQGGPEQYCAGGLMQFITQTAGMFGHNLAYYMDHPDEMIADAANLIVVGGPSKRAYGGGVVGKRGDVLSVVKMYNGGSPCGGGGLTGHGGQGDYVSKFVRVCNTFVEMALAPASSPITAIGSASPLLCLGVFALGAATFLAADYYLALTDRAVGAL